MRIITGVVLLATSVALGGCFEGPKGDKGDKGDAGIPGIGGAAGPTGAAGPAGPTGPAGPAGPKGDKGDKGDAGAAALAFRIVTSGGDSVACNADEELVSLICKEGSPNGRTCPTAGGATGLCVRK